MTGSARRPREPGMILLKIATIIFSEPVLRAVVIPTIADLQREAAEAGPSRAKRARALWRGYRAFWTLALLGPFVRWGSVTGQVAGVASPDASVRLSVGLLIAVVVVFAVGGRGPGLCSAGLALASALVALLIHAWHDRHPSGVPTPMERPHQYWPEINFSSTDVGGNIGGLIFVLGTVLIVVVGLPTVLWFLGAETLGGGIVACVLVAWQTNHSRCSPAKNGILACAETCKPSHRL